MMTRLKNFWWTWTHRCKVVRDGSCAVCTPFMAQLEIAHLHAHYMPCKVCGSRRCRWAQERPAAIAKRDYDKAVNRLVQIFGHG